MQQEQNKQERKIRSKEKKEAEELYQPKGEYLTATEADKKYQKAGNYLSGTDKTLSASGKAADAAAVGETCINGHHY